MNYKDMNIFDICSVLQNLIHDDYLSFGIVFDGKTYPISGVEVGDATIVLHLSEYARRNHAFNRDAKTETES